MPWFFFVILELETTSHLLESVKKTYTNKHMQPRKLTLTHSGISSVFFLLRRPLVPLTDPCPEPTKLPSIEDRDDTLGDTEGEFLEGPRLWVWKVKKIYCYISLTKSLPKSPPNSFKNDPKPFLKVWMYNMWYTYW